MKKLLAALFALTFTAGVFAADMAPATDASKPAAKKSHHHKSEKKAAPKADASPAK